MDEIYLLKKREIDKFNGLDKTHFLNPNAKRVNKSLGDMTGITGFGFHLIEVEPGNETTEYHLHHHEDECIFVLEGEASAIIGNEKHEIGPGDFIGYRKGGLAHSIRNTGRSTLKCIVVGERLAHDVCDYPNQGKRMFRNANMAWNIVDHNAIKKLEGIGKK